MTVYLIAVTTEYFYKIHNNAVAPNTDNIFDSTFQLYLVIIRNGYITSVSVCIQIIRNLIY